MDGVHGTGGNHSSASPNDDGLGSAFVYTTFRMNAIQKAINTLHGIFLILSVWFHIIGSSSEGHNMLVMAMQVIKLGNRKSRNLKPGFVRGHDIESVTRHHAGACWQILLALFQDQMPGTEP